MNDRTLPSNERLVRSLRQTRADGPLVNPDGDEAALTILGLERDVERLNLEFRLSGQQAAALRDERDRLRGALMMIAEGVCPSLVPPMTAEQIARAALDGAAHETNSSNAKFREQQAESWLSVSRQLTVHNKDWVLGSGTGEELALEEIRRLQALDIHAQETLPVAERLTVGTKVRLTGPLFPGSPRTGWKIKTQPDARTHFLVSHPSGGCISVPAEFIVVDEQENAQKPSTIPAGCTYPACDCGEITKCKANTAKANEHQASDEIRDLACCDTFIRESASEFCATCGYTNLDHLRKRASQKASEPQTHPDAGGFCKL